MSGKRFVTPEEAVAIAGVTGGEEIRTRPRVRGEYITGGRGFRLHRWRVGKREVWYLYDGEGDWVLKGLTRPTDEALRTAIWMMRQHYDRELAPDDPRRAVLLPEIQ